MADATQKPPPPTPAAAGGGTSRHIANESNQWIAVCTQPDYCWVGDHIVPFDSCALIGNHILASTNVFAQGKPVYRVDDMHQGVLGDAGAHIVAGTSLGSGCVKFLTGQNNVRVNGKPVVRDGSECLVNCNAQGEGGAQGKLITARKAAYGVFASPEKPTGLGMMGQGFKEMPAFVVDSLVAGAQSADRAFTSLFGASMNLIGKLLLPKKVAPYPEATGFGAGFHDGVKEKGASQTGALAGMSSPFGGGAEDFPVGTFPPGKPVDPARAALPGYQGGKDAAGIAADAALLGMSGGGVYVEARSIVFARGRIGDRVFTDVNPRARDPALADRNKPTLISDRVAAKEAAKPGKPFPNGNMETAHAEIGVIQQAYEAGISQGADMNMTVIGLDVCGYCKGDIAAAAEKAGMNSITIKAIDAENNKILNYTWKSGMDSIGKSK